MTEILSKLEEQIGERRREITTERYSMSLGELSNLYRDGEIIIRPQFQRFFRWEEDQKSALIESILLRIPLPPIFVATIEGGAWELVDGLQRTSTILQLQGLLPDKDPLVLGRTKYLPAMEGLVWESDDPTKCLSEAQRLDIKRARIDVQIIQRDSSPESKYDLFQRLNGFGESLTPQELRNAALSSVSNSGFERILELAAYPPFKEVVTLTERETTQQVDVEHVLRFLICYQLSDADIGSLKDFRGILDESSLKIAQAAERGDPSFEKSATVFRQAFDIISQNGGESVFRKYSTAKNQFTGPFLLTSFEVVALGLGWAIGQGRSYRTDLMKMSEDLWTNGSLYAGMVTGKSTEQRMRLTIPLGRSAIVP